MYELPAPAQIDLQSEPGIQLRKEVYDVQHGSVLPMHDAVEPVVPVDKTPEVLLPVGVRWWKIHSTTLGSHTSHSSFLIG